jgi:hypothetical protein
MNVAELYGALTEEDTAKVAEEEKQAAEDYAYGQFMAHGFAAGLEELIGEE